MEGTKGDPGAVSRWGFGSYEKMETKHSPQQEGDKSQDYCFSAGDRLFFPPPLESWKSWDFTTMRVRKSEGSKHSLFSKNLDERPVAQ